MTVYCTFSHITATGHVFIIKSQTFIAEKRLNLIRSTSTLPVPTPSSQPPTPTRLAGTGSTFDYQEWEEDRGDLIRFYNSVFVKKIKNFAMKFSTNNLKDGVSNFSR